MTAEGQTWMDAQGIMTSEEGGGSAFVKDLAVTQGHSIAQQVSVCCSRLAVNDCSS